MDLLLLDCLLTNKDPRGGRGEDNWLPRCCDLPEEYPTYYCSDGGYSRISFNTTGQPVLDTVNEMRRLCWEQSPEILRVRLRIARNFQRLRHLLSGTDAAESSQPEAGASDAGDREGAVAAARGRDGEAGVSGSDRQR
jgi:hypothetical protein